MGEFMEIKAKKSLGQNFLKDEGILKKIANSFEVSKDDLIIEIGPGKGALTKYLIQKPCALLCYELDERMKDILFSFHSENCKIIFDDFLNRDISSDIKNTYQNIYVIANIPYYITTPIISHLIQSKVNVAGMTLLVQREVADRFVAEPGTKDYGFYSVYLQHFFNVEKLFDVSPHCFEPVPKVWSTVVRFVKRNNDELFDREKWQSFLKLCFSHKRKTLKNNVGSIIWDKIYPYLLSHGFPNQVRAEQLSYHDYIELMKYL